MFPVVYLRSTWTHPNRISHSPGRTPTHRWITQWKIHPDTEDLDYGWGGMEKPMSGKLFFSISPFLHYSDQTAWSESNYENGLGRKLALLAKRKRKTLRSRNKKNRQKRAGVCTQLEGNELLIFPLLCVLNESVWVLKFECRAEHPDRKCMEMGAT